ncbi:hypothetical protein BPOR_1800g00010 [Botrytis porri]|uniref:Uncharacterized protein n=1 Tax=Botrytis porri TaxID=87229 RepID=A0A4Z1K819_9HELO|nr:hypothetical protein BPOR_1800g00010 [Botrytis porri]
MEWRSFSTFHDTKHGVSYALTPNVEMYGMSRTLFNRGFKMNPRSADSSREDPGELISIQQRYFENRVETEIEAKTSRRQVEKVINRGVKDALIVRLHVCERFHITASCRIMHAS